MSLALPNPKPRISAEMFTRMQTQMTETRRAIDAFSNPLARLGVGSNNLLEGTEYPLTRLSFQYLLLQSLYRSNWVARKVVDAPAEDLTKNWVRIDTELSPAQIKQFEAAVKITGTRNHLLTAIKWSRLFGGAAAIMILEGQEDQLEEPLDPDDVELDSFKGLIPLDRWSGIYPSGALGGDVNRPLEFGLPEYYQVNPAQGASFKIHASRVLRFIGPDLPVWEKQVEQYWGISTLEPMYDELKKFDNTSWNIASLIFRANILALKQKDLSQMLSGLGSSAQAQKNFYAVLQAQSSLMSNQGIMVLPEDGGLETHQYSFGGITEVYESFKENICGATGIPYSRLFGRPPGGLSTTNEGDEHAYYENISAQQNRDLDPQMLKLMPVIAMSAWGKVPKDFSWTYNPVRALSNEARSTLAKEKSDSIVAVFNAGLISPRTSLLELKQMNDETGMWSNITDDDIEAAEDTVAPPMEAGMGGMPGEEAMDADTVTDSYPQGTTLRAKQDIQMGRSKVKAGSEFWVANPPQNQESTGTVEVATKRQRMGQGKRISAAQVSQYFTTDAAAKMTKAEVAFEHPAEGKDHCGACSYYRGGECAIVAGPIAPEDWCEEFKAKAQATDAGYKVHLKGIGGPACGASTTSRSMNMERRGLTDDPKEVTCLRCKADYQYLRAVEKQKTQAQDENPDIERRVTLPFGLTAYIENEEGSVRSGPWGSVIMKHPYGYLAATEGRDGDAVDCFLGAAYETANTVYVIHQGGTDEEDKLMLGFLSAKAAADAYEMNYTSAPPYTMDKVKIEDLPAQLVKLAGRKITA